MEKLEFTGESVPIKVASQVMKKDAAYIRQGLINKVLPFGCAVLKEGAKRYSYYISPKAFYEYTGYVYRGQRHWQNSNTQRSSLKWALKYFRYERTIKDHYLKEARKHKEPRT